MIKEYDQLVKLILIGGSGVGKSSLLMQFSENKFTQNYLTTIGVDFRFKTVKYASKTIKFQIWDTAGQERFRTITSAYYKGADGIIMVYDLTDPSSLDDIEKFWIPEAYNYCDKNIKVLLLGNKSDSEKVISEDRVKKIIEKHQFFVKQEVSAKTGHNVQEAIKDFGLSVSKVKMQMMGTPSFETPRPSENENKNEQSVKQGKPQKKLQLSSSKNKVPSYQKKCC